LAHDGPEELLDCAQHRLAKCGHDERPRQSRGAAMKRINYRKVAFQHYPQVCAYCGFGIAAVLEVCHIDCQRSNNDVGNLVILCPTCHKMHDLDIISTETICTMRDRPKVVRWSKRMKDAGKKAALSRRQRELARRRKRHKAAVKAAETRARNRTQTIQKGGPQ
jgi:hypothetical protein